MVQEGSYEKVRFISLLMILGDLHRNVVEWYRRLVTFENGCQINARAFRVEILLKIELGTEGIWLTSQLDGRGEALYGLLSYFSRIKLLASRISMSTLSVK